MSLLHISSHRLGPWSVVEVAAELDTDGRDELRRTLLGDIDAHEPAWVVVDFSHLEFCDATGLGVVVAARKATEKRSGRLHILCQ